MTRASKPHDFAPKKQPSQERAQATFDALVEACTWLLPRRGYAGATTNHIARRAGVNIASLYEYFPGKDAIVAQVAERLVERVLGRLETGAAELARARERDAVRRWIELIHDTVARERELVAVFLNQIPYTNQLEPIRAIGARLVELSQNVQTRAGGSGRGVLSGASLHLLINLVTSTIMQIVQDPPQDLTQRALLDELTRRVESWGRL
ncbi:MAG: TetR/AcrR family transcriptional regulator [Myxococcota bacterium]